jgi:hypothetical protein
MPDKAIQKYFKIINIKTTPYLFLYFKIKKLGIISIINNILYLKFTPIKHRSHIFLNCGTFY